MDVLQSWRGGLVRARLTAGAEQIGAAQERLGLCAAWPCTGTGGPAPVLGVSDAVADRWLVEKRDFTSDPARSDKSFGLSEFGTRRG